MTDYTRHPEWRGLLAAIRAAPDDDLPRLVAADWLDEHGQAERAAVIRFEVKPEQYPLDPHRLVIPDKDWNHLLFRGWTDPNGSRYDAANRRFVNVEPNEWANWWWRCEERWLVGPHHARLSFHRGFADVFRGPLAAWIGGECEAVGPHHGDSCDGSGRVLSPNSQFYQHCRVCSGTGRTVGIGPAVVAAHPVELVEVTDREPHSDEGDTAFWCRQFPDATMTDPWGLPAFMFDLLTGYSREENRGGPYRKTRFYPTRELAKAALSTALIAWAKAQLTESRL